MKPYTLFLLSLFLACRIYAQAPIAFERYYDFGWGYGEEGRCVQQTTDSGYIVCGVQNRGIGDTRMLLTKTNSTGNVQWTKLWGNGNDQQEAYAVKQTNDGGYILTGFLAGTNYSKYPGLVKTDSNGDTLWTKKFNGLVITSAGWGPRGEDVLQMPDSGYVVIAVGSDVVDTVAETILIRTDANGDTLWTKKYRRLYGCGGNSIRQTADGGFIIGGYVALNNTNYFSATYLIKTNAIGDTLWTKILNGSNTQAAGIIQCTSDGGYFIRGIVVYPNSSSDILLIKTDSIGDTLWTKAIGGSQNEGGGGNQLQMGDILCRLQQPAMEQEVMIFIW